MKNDSISNPSVDRRDFVLGSLLAMLGGVTITISSSACSSSSSPTAPTPPPADKAGEITSNHGHAAVVTSAQQLAGGAISLNIQGTASHNHVVELTADQVNQIRDGQKVSNDCSRSNGTGHYHTVTFN